MLCVYYCFIILFILQPSFSNCNATKQLYSIVCGAKESFPRSKSSFEYLFKRTCPSFVENKIKKIIFFYTICECYTNYMLRALNSMYVTT